MNSILVNFLHQFFFMATMGFFPPAEFATFSFIGSDFCQPCSFHSAENVSSFLMFSPLSLYQSGMGI